MSKSNSYFDWELSFRKDHLSARMEREKFKLKIITHKPQKVKKQLLTEPK